MALVSKKRGTGQCIQYITMYVKTKEKKILAYLYRHRLSWEGYITSNMVTSEEGD